MSKQQNLFVDIETSGLKPGFHVPLAIGFILDGGSEESEQKMFTVKVIPTLEEWGQANPDALRINGLTLEHLQAKGQLPDIARALIGKFLIDNNVTSETTQYVGQNCDFDISFLKAFMKDELDWLDFPWGSECKVDTIQLAKKASSLGVPFKSFKGSAISEALGVEPEGAVHYIETGIESLRRNYYALVKKIDELQKEKVNVSK